MAGDFKCEQVHRLSCTGFQYAYSLTKTTSTTVLKANNGTHITVSGLLALVSATYPRTKWLLSPCILDRF